jgi:hypothetical protein
MQVVVSRSQLALDAPRVVCTFEDSIETEGLYGPGFAVLSLPPLAVVNTRLGPFLAAGWRDANREAIVNGEATRRILRAFPEHAQRNAALELAILTARHGGSFPREAQKRMAEIESLWTYIGAVRQAARAMVGAPPSDPTADAHWPKR